MRDDIPIKPKVIYEKLGEEIFVGDWETIDQERINNFADITGDKQWIHINTEKAKQIKNRIIFKI